jgi:hypothetical protein
MHRQREKLGVITERVRLRSAEMPTSIPYAFPVVDQTFRRVDMTESKTGVYFLPLQTFMACQFANTAILITLLSD